MIAALPTLRMLAPVNRAVRVARARAATVLVASAVVDAVTARVLLLGTPVPRSLEILAVAVCHATAVMLLCHLERARPSRRWLCVAAVLTVPLVGAAVAATILVTRGRGSIVAGRHRKVRPRGGLDLAAMRRLAVALSPCDALDSGDEEERRGALATLSRRADPDAIAVLRRAAASRDPDLALSAALALDEIGERAERQVDRLALTKVRRGAV